MNPALEIDLDAGFRAVARHQLAGTWQVPAELVRMAISCGARDVEAHIRSRKTIIEAIGAEVPFAAIEGLATILDDGGNDLRLGAFAALEDLDAMALGWAVGSNPRRLKIEQRSPEGGIALVRNGESRAQVTRLNPAGESILRVVIESPNIDHQQAAAWLRTAGRFAEIPLRLNNEDIRSDLTSGCFRSRLERPLPTSVALGVSLETPRLWLLRHGILEARVSVPGWPAFEGAVELAGEVGGWVSPADLRRSVAPHLPDLISRVVGLMLRIVPRFPDLKPSCREALVAALLTAVEKGVRRQEVERAPIFQLAGDGRRQWVSLADLDRWSGPPPAVVDPTNRSQALGIPTLRLGERELVRVGAILGIVFRSVPPAGYTVGTWLRGALGSVLQSIWALLGSPSIPDENLRPGERNLARGLARSYFFPGGDVSVVFISGRGPVRQTRLVLRLPRGNPLVQECVRAVSGDSRWLYVAARALGSPGWVIDDGLRRSWIVGG